MNSFLAILSVPIYFSPTIAAIWRNRTDPDLAGKPLGNIVFINLFLGWTIIGWLIAWYMVIAKRFGEAGQMAEYFASSGAAGSAPQQADQSCLHCGGSGRMTCTTCGGAGTEYAQPGAEHGMPAGCGTCSRSGRITCYHCNGSGRA